MKPGVLVFDVEGTLTDKSGRYIEDDLLERLRVLHRSGFSLILCSGRDVSYLVEKINEWILPITDFVAENGSVIVVRGKEILTYNPSPFPREKIIEKIESIDILAKGEFDPAKKHMITIYPRGFLKGKDYSSKDIQILLKKTKQILKGFDATITYSSASVDIIPKGVDKGTGLKKLCEKSGIDPSTILFCGDGDNDVPAAKYVKKNRGIVAVPKNAAPQLKKIADFVSKKENGKGVKEILGEYVR
ncbi:MAG: HAD family hydrolase [Candidatus Altiarchaeota archaeon]